MPLHLPSPPLQLASVRASWQQEVQRLSGHANELADQLEAAWKDAAAAKAMLAEAGTGQQRAAELESQVHRLEREVRLLCCFCC
mgnify:CR=1 FL=1